VFATGTAITEREKERSAVTASTRILDACIDRCVNEDD